MRDLTTAERAGALGFGNARSNPGTARPSVWDGHEGDTMSAAPGCPWLAPPAPVAPAVGPPTESVDLYVDSKKVGDKQLDGAGRTSFVLPKLEVGGHNTYAIYRGDREFGQSVSQPIVQVIESS
ncbi:MAG: Ig-like domain repeat protein [Acidimicrobiales bacterium]